MCIADVRPSESWAKTLSAKRFRQNVFPFLIKTFFSPFQNFLNNFSQSSIIIAITRLMLFLQLITVFPLLMYIFRNQALALVLPNEVRAKRFWISSWSNGTFFNFQDNPSIFFKMFLNIILIGIAITTAIFYPKMGDIIRYVKPKDLLLIRKFVCKMKSSKM